MLLNIQPPTSDDFNAWVEYIQALRGNRENAARKEASHRLHTLYAGKQRQETKSALALRVGQQVNLNKHPVWTQNLLKYGVGLLASTYDGLIERSVGDVDEETQNSLQNKVWKHLNRGMQTLSHFLIFDKMNVVQVSTEDDHLKYTIYAQYQFDLVRENNNSLLAVILSDYAEQHEKTNYYIYTNSFTWHLHGNSLVSQEPNEMGILPFVVVASEDLGFQDYLDPIEEYADGQIELNCLLSGNLYTHQLQSHSVLWMRLTPDSSIGETAEDGHQLDTNVPGQQLPLPSANQAVTIYEDEQGRKEEIGYLSPGVNFDDLLGVGKEYAFNYLENMGIPRDTVTIDVLGGTVKPATSGYLAERKLRDLNAPYRQIFAEIEKEIYQLGLSLFPIIGLNLSLNKDDFVVSFYSQPRRLDTLEVADLTLLKDKDILDAVEVLRTIKGITRSEAKMEMEKYDKNKPEPAQNPFMALPATEEETEETDEDSDE